MRRMLTVALAAVAVLALAVPANAVTRGGVPDGGTHPYVGFMLASTQEGPGATPQWRCSGSAISPTVFVTAGHCTVGAKTVWVSFESDLQPLRLAGGSAAVRADAGTVTGTAHDHPLYDDDAFFLYDLGVVVLDEPVSLSRYASLPAVGQLDTLGRGRKAATVTAVGYGLQGVVPEFRDDWTRYRADLMVVDTTGVVGMNRFFRSMPGTGSFTVSGDAKHGGTCFGDSGGPMLVGDTIVGVNSFGLNANCAGIGGAYRIDKEPDLAFIRSFLTADATAN